MSEDQMLYIYYFGNSELFYVTYNITGTYSTYYTKLEKFEIWVLFIIK